jgi:putative endonuclease
MYYAYVLYSPEFSKLYKGHCSDLNKRLSGHNSGNTKSTRNFRPWILVYSESYNSLEEAIQREKYFKTAAGRRFLKIRIDITG